MGVPGVREFINAGDAIFTGFEFAANSRLFDLLNVDLGASYTFAEYTDSGDPVAEIAPFETTMRLSGILFNRVSPMLNVRKVFPQGRFDAAFGEERTSGFWLVDVEAGYSILSGLRLNAGVRNLFDEAYMEHLNRNFTPEFNTERNKLMEPGRRVFVEISYRF
jgi:iron complex outermembrane receptor protein